MVLIAVYSTTSILKAFEYHILLHPNFGYVTGDRGDSEALMIAGKLKSLILMNMAPTHLLEW